jgi:single-strand DNA-binding protein
MSLNKVILLGNVGKAPDVQKTASGTPVVKFSLATSERYKDRSGEVKEQTEWHTVRCWKATAEFVGNYVKKGSQVLVEGRLRTESWEGNDGQTRKQVLVEAENVQLLDRKEKDSEARPTPQSEPRITGAKPQQRQAQSFDPQADDLPF